MPQSVAEGRMWQSQGVRQENADLSSRRQLFSSAACLDLNLLLGAPQEDAEGLAPAQMLVVLAAIRTLQSRRSG